MSKLGFVLACVALAMSPAQRQNPIEAALHMISNLQAMVLSQAADAQKLYTKYAAHCEERSREIMFAVKSEKAEVSSLKAVIDSNSASIGLLNSKIEDVSSEISSSENQLEAATAMRDKESDMFSREQVELQDIIGALERAISIFSKKEGIALLQANNANSITAALSTLVEASAMDANDALKLSALVQEKNSSPETTEDEDDDDAALDSFSRRSMALLESSSQKAKGSAPVSFTQTLPPPPPPGVAPDPPPGMAPDPMPDNSAPVLPSPDTTSADPAKDKEVDWRTLLPATPGHSPPALLPEPFQDVPKKTPGMGIGVGPSTPSAGASAGASAAAKAAAAAAGGAPVLKTTTLKWSDDFDKVSEDDDDDFGDYEEYEEDDGIDIVQPTANQKQALPPIAVPLPTPSQGAIEVPLPTPSQGATEVPLPTPSQGAIAVPLPIPSLGDASPSAPAYQEYMPPSPPPMPPLRHKPVQNVDIPMPKAIVYEGRGGSIVSVLESLLEKASSQLDELQQTESRAAFNYKKLKASLHEGLEVSEKEMSEAKTSLPQKQEVLSVATGDLQAVSKDLQGDMAAKEALKHECMSAAEEFQASVTNRNDELKALTEAKQSILDTTGPAACQVGMIDCPGRENDPLFSFMQRTSQTDGDGLGKTQVVRFVRDLSAKLGSQALAQLASRMSNAFKFGTTGQPFAKVKDMIADMLVRLEADADSDAELKAYCDKELSATAEKQEDSQDERDRLHTEAEQKRSRSSKLRADISTLQRELADLAASKSKAAQIRQNERTAFLKSKSDMEEGLRGIKLALKILKEHYGQDEQSNLLTQGASGGIIGLLEVVETDFTKGLAEILVAEESAESYYQSTVKPSSEIEASAKEADLKARMKEYITVNKEGADLSNDAGLVSERLAGIAQYEAMLKSKCVQSDTFGERKIRREKELAGLKEALTILTGEASFLQMESTHRLRGAGQHVHS
jgi:hypothetical protein